MIKRIPPGYINCLANCFNTWLEEYRYPDVWKLAKIITLNKIKAGVPRCEQTRPISLLATHSNLFEKIMLERIRLWAETNSLVPIEQSGFRPGFIVKLNRLSIPLGLLKLIESWLNDRRAYVIFGENKSDIFCTYVGLPQGSSLSPYLFIVYHCDLVACVGAHSSHIFANDLNILISAPICREIKPMIKFLEEEGTKICNQIANYSKKWKQPVNVSKAVAQIFHSQVQSPIINVFMDGKKLEVVKEFKYLGFAWTNKMSLKPTIDNTLENIQRTFTVTVSLDRFLRSEYPIKSRIWCTTTNVAKLCVIYCLFSMILYAIFFHPRNVMEADGQCSFPYDNTFRLIILKIMPPVRFVFICIMPVILMGIFGGRMLYNIKQVKKRITQQKMVQDAAIATIVIPKSIQNIKHADNQNRTKKLDHMLLLMVFTNIISYIITQTPFSIYTLFYGYEISGSYKTCSSTFVDNYILHLSVLFLSDSRFHLLFKNSNFEVDFTDFAHVRILMPQYTKLRPHWSTKTDSEGRNVNKWLKQGENISTFKCTLCNTSDLDCSNQDWATIVQHMKTKAHWTSCLIRVRI
ncbi:unnamed protein product [Rotaria magnacalcarata]